MSRRTLPFLFMGAIAVALFAVNLMVFAGCPQTQVWNKICPTPGPNCQNGPAKCTNRQGTGRWTDDFDCQPNPGNQTKCVNQTTTNGDPIEKNCSQIYSCKIDPDSGLCVVDKTKPVGVPQAVPVYKTVNC